MNVTFESQDFWNFDATVAEFLAEGLRHFVAENGPSMPGAGYPESYGTMERYNNTLTQLAADFDLYAEDSMCLGTHRLETIWTRFVGVVQTLWI